MSRQVEYKFARCVLVEEREYPREFRPKKVILVGAGAIEKAWEPMIKLLKETPPFDVESEPAAKQYFENKDLTVHILANQSFMYRGIRNSLLRKLPKGINSATYNNFKLMIDGFIKFRNNIGSYYVNALDEGLIDFRKELDLVKDRIDPIETGVITTNWDELLWKNHELFPNLVQLHGKASEPQSLVLPTELTTDEEYFKHLNFSQFIQGCHNLPDTQQEITRFYDDKCHRGNLIDHLELAHDTAVHWLSSAEEVIVWGVKFNAYDAELNSIVNISNHPAEPLRKLTVIDIDQKHARFVAGLMRFPENKVKFIRARKNKSWICHIMHRFHDFL